MWVTYGTWTGGWKVAYDTNAMVANTTVSLANAKHTLALSNKVTPWSTNPTISVSTDIAKTNGLGTHPSSLTYGWTMTALTQASIQASNYVGAS